MKIDQMNAIETGTGTAGATAGMEPDLLTVREVCRRLSISRPTFYKLVRRDALSPVRLGTAIRIRATDLSRLVKEGCPSGEAVTLGS